MCKHCGYCEHCGRGGGYHYDPRFTNPWYAPLYPTWPSPGWTITSGNTNDLVDRGNSQKFTTGYWSPAEE